MKQKYILQRLFMNPYSRQISMRKIKKNGIQRNEEDKKKIVYKGKYQGLILLKKQEV